MRKLHSQFHIAQHIKDFGPIWYADTSDWESCHKAYTTEIWRGTSKRKSTIEKEMLNATVVQSHSGHLAIRNMLLEVDGVAQLQKHFGPKPDNDNLIIKLFDNIADIRFIVTPNKDRNNNNIFKGIGFHKDKFKESLFKHYELPNSSHLSKRLQERCSQEMWNAISKENTMYEFSIVRAASYEGSKDSGVGKGVIYAMSKDNRYDYVNVKVSYSETEEDVQVAQVLSIIQMHHMKINDNNKRIIHSTKWFFIVQYMIRTTNEEENKHEYISTLKWETVITNNNKIRKFNVDIVSLDSIAGSAMVIPFFSNLADKKSKTKIQTRVNVPLIIIGQPKIVDRFWYVERKFFDRSGWVKLHEVQSKNYELNLNNIQSFIDRNYIQPAIQADDNLLEVGRESEDEDDSSNDNDSLTRHSSSNDNGYESNFEEDHHEEL